MVEWPPNDHIDFGITISLANGPLSTVDNNPRLSAMEYRIVSRVIMPEAPGR